MNNYKKSLSQIVFKLKDSLTATNLEDFVYPLRTQKSKTSWLEFFDRNLLFSGTIFIIASVIFFFAYNWQDMHHLVKLGLIVFTIWLVLLIQLKTSINQNLSSALIFFALFLIGVFLAVFGQSYQTGANSWNLFFAWTVMSLPLVLIHRGKTSFFFLIILSNITMVFYLQQNYPVSIIRQQQILALALILCNLIVSLVIIYFEMKSKKMTWLQITQICFLVIEISIVSFNSIIHNYLLINPQISVYLWLALTFVFITLSYYSMIFRFSKVISSVILLSVIVIAVTAILDKSRFSLEMIWISALFFLVVSFLSAKLIMFLDKLSKDKDNAII